ncbi:MAG: hypothetical protein EOP88_13755 [Verrucomicrobiaceae bacterium]|nr:MAG: hypothetical protein EOP88_13755 [Verrucomicrobiaceae bacterium]
MTPTVLTNLALSKIGHTLIKALGDTTSKEARLAALHYEPCLREALRAHFWSFAMTTRPLEAVDVREYLEVGGALRIGSRDITFPRIYLMDSRANGKDAFSEDAVADSEIPLSTASWTESGEWELVHGPTAAIWKRGLDVDSPEKVKLRPFSPKHFLETSLEGEDNDLRFEVVDQGEGSSFSVEYRPLVEGFLTKCTLNGRSLIVTPADKAIMIVSGTLSNGENVFTVPPLFQTTLINGRPSYTNSFGTPDYRISWHDGTWYLHIMAGSGYFWISYDDAVTPDLASIWMPTGLAVGIPTFSPAPSTAEHVAGLISGQIEASAVVTVVNREDNHGKGYITTMPKTSLSGGLTGVPVIRRVTPATELSGWSHAFELPGDFVKARALLAADGRKIEKFAIRRVAGRTCVLCNHAAVSLEYVQYLDEPAVFDPLFVKAFTTLFAAKLARAISGSDDMEARFLQIFETVDLPAARTASGHETDSNENHPLRELLDGTLTPGRGDFFGRR